MGARKTILVTGGAGFVGSYLCARLATDGHRVISLDNYFTGARADIPGVEARAGHTKDIDALVPEQLDIIFHLGEYARPEKSLEDPIELVWDLNMTGTFAVVESWRRRNASTPCKLVYAGSSTKFADGDAGRFQSPYAWTKAANTDIIRTYGDVFKLPFAITYFYNVFGPSERGQGPYATVIAIWIEQLRRGEPLTVVSPGTQKRNFTHVDDIVDGLMFAAEKGQGDGYGIGNDRTYSVLEAARLFNTDIVMLPQRRGNRMAGPVESAKLKALGWRAKRPLEEYVRSIIAEHTDVPKVERRVLVFSTTFHPVAGLAENALLEAMRALPDIHFDVVTAAFSEEARSARSPLPNVTVHRVGSGRQSDKYRLPFAGARVARTLLKQHSYLFAWSVMASYGAIAAIRARPKSLPLLITLADQRLDSIPWYAVLALRFILSDADQISSSNASQEGSVKRIAPQAQMTSSNKRGDAFANAIRFLYNDVLRTLIS